MIEYAYTTRWNAKTGRPVAEHRWLDETEAREAFAAHSLEVVRVVKRRESDGAVRAMWVMGLAYKAGVRVQWLNGKHSVWRLNDYQWLDGRLFRRVTVDYGYPDADRRYGLSECTAMRELVVLPDGSGHAVQDLKSEPTRLVAKFTDYRTYNLWIDYPEFGDWESLADPNFGIDPE